MPYSYSVIDLSHWETERERRIDFEAVRDDGVRAVIHKATQGISGRDDMYASAEQDARAADLLWGAFHFGTGANPVRQAAHFLDVVQPESGTLLILDLEKNPRGSSMSIEQAEEFVREIYARTGKWPGLYAGHYCRAALDDNPETALEGLGQCWLWIARYCAKAPEPLALWKNWRLWQYTDGKEGGTPRTVKGIGPCDRSVFDGSEAELVDFWRQNAW